MPVNFAVKAAVTVAMMAAQTALTMSRKIEGPRLDDTKFTGGDYGASLAMVWGMRRLDVPIFWAEELREVKRRRKTKGGKFNEYTYYGTWAVALAGHQIEAVRRIWFDTHLIYDVSGAGPVTPFDFGANATGAMISDYITIYTGTTTQTADPRMEATVEAEFGEGSCPAYRDTAYIVFKDIPLEKIGNRIPQVSVEMLGAAADAYPYETFDTLEQQPNRLWGFTFSPDYSRFMWGLSAGFEMWDTASRSRMISGNWPVDIQAQQTFGLYNDGTILAVGNSYESLYRLTADAASGAEYFTFTSTPDNQEGVQVVEDGNGTEHWLTIPRSTNSLFYMDGADYETVNLTGIEWKPMQYFPDALGNIWAVGRKTGTWPTTAYFFRIVTVLAEGPAFIVVPSLPEIGSPLGNVAGCYHDGGLILAWDSVAHGNKLYRIDVTDGTVTHSASGSFFDEYNMPKQFINKPSNAASVWLNSSNTAHEISLTDLTTIRSIAGISWMVQDMDGVVYDPVNHALITAPQLDQEISFRYLDRIGVAGVTLSSIAGDIAGWCGVEDYDFTALNQTVTGWSATRGAGSNMLEPLLDAYDSDIAPHDFTIRGIKRTGTASGAALLTEKFVGDPRYAVTVRQASELPRALLIDFADVDADQQPNSVRSDRPLDATQARGEKKIDLTTLVMDVDTARGLADRHFRRVWNERKEISLSLTAQNIGLEPGDVRTLSLDGDTITARCISVTVAANDVLATQWRYDHPSLALVDATGGAAFAGRNEQTIAVPLISKGFVLDVPLLTDADDDTVPQAYTLAAPYAAGTWPGAVIYRETGGEYTDEVAEVLSSAQATWGRVAELMAYANPNLWDRGTELTVTLQTGELTGCTEAAANADPALNLCAIGSDGWWELVQFTVATLTAPLTYTVSGFKRGRRGTEWAAELHAANDTFVLLDTAAPQDFGLSDVGVAQSFKAITAGRTNGFAFGYTYEGQSLMPYAPTALDAVKDAGTGDWALSWIRRTRIGGAWTSGTAIPLGEATEEYEVEIMNGATVVRTIAALSSPATTYTDAQQVTDFGSTQSSVTFRVYQISATVDRGFMAEATI